jgi:hypothetical protein
MKTYLSQNFLKAANASAWDAFKWAVGGLTLLIGALARRLWQTKADKADLNYLGK